MLATGLENCRPECFAEVQLPVDRDAPTLFVPASAVGELMDRTFVDLIRDNRIKRVGLMRDPTQNDLVEVFGDLTERDLVVVGGSEELYRRNGGQHSHARVGDRFGVQVKSGRAASKPVDWSRTSR